MLDEFCKGAEAGGAVIEKVYLYDLNLTYFNYGNRKAEPPAQTPGEQADPRDTSAPSLPVIIEAQEPASKFTSSESSAVTAARNFAERFASFSSDSQFTNFEELKPISSARMIQTLQSLIDQGSDTSGYYGVSSKVLKVDVLSLAEEAGNSKIAVRLQREENRGGQTSVAYQNLSLDLIKSGNDWLVDGYQWQ